MLCSLLEVIWHSLAPLPVKWASCSLIDSQSLIDSSDRQLLHAEACVVPVLRKQSGEIEGFSQQVISGERAEVRSYQ